MTVLSLIESLPEDMDRETKEQLVLDYTVFGNCYYVENKEKHGKKYKRIYPENINLTS